MPKSKSYSHSDAFSVQADQFEERYRNVMRAFSRDDLARVCAMHESEFAAAYQMDVTEVTEQEAPSNFYLFKDNGSNVLAVAHLDTVGLHHEREAHFLETAGGEVVYSRALDDRLGAYIILELLPALGITYDILLTVGEEDGQSTAAFFEAPAGKDYHRMIEFDRGGTDVVMYQYEDDDLWGRVRDSGARVGSGIFSDICYLEHLGIKGVNWGVGYRDYHSARAHAYLEDTYLMVTQYLKFHEDNDGVMLEHHEEPSWSSYSKGTGSYGWRLWDDDDLKDIEELEREKGSVALWTDDGDEGIYPAVIEARDSENA